MIWIVLGSSPRAPETLPVAKAMQHDYLITCNKGIWLEPAPTHYLLMDALACETLYPEAYEAREKHGTKLITLKRHVGSLTRRHVQDFDDFVKEGPPYFPFQLSGLRCMEYAVHNGATRLILVGMDGYPKDISTPARFDGSTTNNPNMTEKIIAPWMQRFTETYPQIEVVKL